MSNIIDKKIFKQKTGQITGQALANKLINTTNKEQNQSIVKKLTQIKKNFTNKKKRRLMIG